MKPEVIKKHYDTCADKFDNSTKEFSDRLFSRLNISPNLSILDIGCGSGNVTFEIHRRYSPKHITGVDISDKLVNIARDEQKKRGIKNIEFVQGNAMDLQFADNSFDAIISNMVFHLLDDHSRAMKEMHRVLKPGKMAIISFQGQRPIAPEFFKLLSEAYEEVADSRQFPELFNIININDLGSMADELGITRFEVDWYSNIASLDKSNFKKYLSWFNLVSGYWREDLTEEEIEKIANQVNKKIADHYTRHKYFRVSSSNIIFLFIKGTRNRV